MINVLNWIAIENVGKLFINQKYIDYLNPFIHGCILSSFSIKKLFFNNNLQTDFNTQQLAIINLSTYNYYFNFILFFLNSNKISFCKVSIICG
jgi:hypothetical protein